MYAPLYMASVNLPFFLFTVNKLYEIFIFCIVDHAVFFLRFT